MEGPAEDTLSTHFRQAALSITQLYKETTKASRRAYAQGYASCLQDLWLLLSTADAASTSGGTSASTTTSHHHHHHHHHHQPRRVLTLDDLAAFARSKQDLLDQSGLAFGGYNADSANDNTTTVPMNHSSPSSPPPSHEYDSSAAVTTTSAAAARAVVSTNNTSSTSVRRDRSHTPRANNSSSEPQRPQTAIPHSDSTYAPTLPSFTFQMPPPPSSGPSFFPSYNTQPNSPFSFGSHDNDSYVPTSDGSLKRRRNNNNNNQNTDDMMYSFFGAHLPSAFMSNENAYCPPSSKKGRWRKSDDRMMSD
ncbi:hypothetical protein SeLEV6574_g03698 [Synchytrium endobioticum]|uniref:Uncharacterized protein n=1 Tax=Synchytrium endobioticum TaxID=286115 RepID=A0A507D2Q5_9FUNG|nr:hypothetical protein SeLEV6574_g03698 [Synchytrium endobioticum]